MDLAYLACGRLDGFWERELKPWDTAAGYLPEILASNPFLHEKLVELLG